MKRLCFGSLYKILYQARINKVTQPELCNKIAKCFSVEYEFDSTSAGHLMSGHDNPPLVLVDAVKNCNIDAARAGFDEYVIPILKTTLLKEVIKAIQILIADDDTISDETLVGKTVGYEKKVIVSSTSFLLADLLCNAFFFAVVCVNNRECKNEIKSIGKDFVKNLSEEAKCIQFPLSSEPLGVNAALLPTLNSNSLSAFSLMSEGMIDNLPNKTNAQIYSVSIRNNRFDYIKLKEIITDAISSYVFSRVQIDEANTLEKSRRLGLKGMQRFLQTYREQGEALLGEILLYIFLEIALKAPKILSKVEIDDITGRIKSNSECMHLLAPSESGLTCHQLVCGASNVCGDFHEAIDRAFNRIMEMSADRDNEYKFVSTANFNQILTPETTAFLIKLIVPDEEKDPIADMSFGVFLGYTVHVNSMGLSNDQYREVVRNQLVLDIEQMKGYIYNKIVSANLLGYSFYFYIVPFNDADNERKSIIDDIIAGG